MDVVAALSELGLASRPTSDELERAYSAAVRRHPPECDPTGYARVREAHATLLGVSSLPSVKPGGPRKAPAGGAIGYDASLFPKPATARMREWVEQEVEESWQVGSALLKIARQTQAARRRGHVPGQWLVAPFLLGSYCVAYLLVGTHSKDRETRDHGQPVAEIAQGTAEVPSGPRDTPRTTPTPAPDVTDPAGLTEAARRVGYLALASRTMVMWAKIQDGTCKASQYEIDEFLRSARLAVQAAPELGQSLEAFVKYIESACDSQVHGSAG